METHSIPNKRLDILKRCYEELCERLNYSDDAKIKRYMSRLLRSEWFQPFFREYKRDYLEAMLVIEDISCTALFARLQENNGAYPYGLHVVGTYIVIYIQ